MQNTLIITDNAAARITELCDKGVYFRISVNGGGCSGFQYEFDYKASKAEKDIEFTYNGATVLVDEISIELIGGAQLDYSEDLGGARFEIKNPNATAKCGCGKSFGI